MIIIRLWSIKILYIIKQKININFINNIYWVNLYYYIYKR